MAVLLRQALHAFMTIMSICTVYSHHLITEGCSEVIEQVDSPCFNTSGGYRLDVSLPGDEKEAQALQEQILKTPGVLLMNRNRYIYMFF